MTTEQGNESLAWRIKIFRFGKDMEAARSRRDAWVKKNRKYQMTEVFINNAYGVEYRKMRRL